MKNNTMNSKGASCSCWKFDLKMKLSTLFILFSLFAMQANDTYGQKIKLSLEMNQVTVNDVIREIESLTDFKFLYNRKDVNLTRIVSVKARKQRVSVILDDIFLNSKTEFEVINKQIVLKRKIILRSIPQEREIKGTVKDKNGIPLGGANVLVKGTTNGTQTDFDGNFTIVVPQENKILTITYIGFKTIELDITDKDIIEIILEEDAAKLDEVVVTALGISRDKKSLGYSVENVDGSEVSEVKNSNFVNSLSGKVAGVNIKASGSMGGSTNVIIRGYSSLTGNNQALFVVDGTPINNSNNNSNDQATGKGGYDFGNAASDINPDDIANISILKGAAATALYGSRGSNGVILITTKTGDKNTALKVSINSSVIVGSADKATLPVYQQEYGSGFGAGFLEVDFDASRPDKFYSDGNASTFDILASQTGNGSFGEPFDPNLSVYQWNSFYPQLDTYGEATPWVAGENTPAAFLESSVTMITGANISGGDEKGAFRLGYTRFSQDGILPNSDLGKHTVSLSASRNFNDKFKASASVNYVKQNTKGRNGSGYDPRSSFMNFRQWWQVSTDILELRDLYFETKENITNNPKSPLDLDPFWFNNPYWERYVNFTTDQRSRYFGNVTLDYKLLDGLSLTGNVSFDTYTENIEERFAVGSSRVPYYSRYNGDISEYNYNLLLNYSKPLNDNISLDGSLGYNLRVNYWDQLKLTTNGGLGVANLYSLSNSVAALEAPDQEFLATKKVESFFGRASLGYKGIFYTDLTYRLYR